jgi:hypothetical protein
MEIKVADVAELVDARDLKSLDGNVVWVRLPPPAPMAEAGIHHQTINCAANFIRFEGARWASRGA